MVKKSLFAILLLIILFVLFSFFNHNQEIMSTSTIDFVLEETSLDDFIKSIEYEEVKVIDLVHISEKEGLVFVGYNETIGFGFWVFTDDSYKWLGRNRFGSFDKKKTNRTITIKEVSPSGIEIEVTMGINEMVKNNEFKDKFIYSYEILD